jgi:uncharacterized protein
MTEHPNVQLVRQAMEAMSRGDFESVAPFLDDDVVWHFIGGSEPIRGKAAMMENRAGADWTIETTIHDVVANDDHTVALVRAHATRGDRTLDYDTAEIMHVRDGKCVERWAFSDDTARIAEFFA